jgi:hypothetical protein
VLQKVVTFGGFKRCVTSFRAAGMALRDIPNVSKAVLSAIGAKWRNTFASFSEDDFRFPWQAQYFRHVALRVFCESRCQGCVEW